MGFFKNNTASSLPVVYLQRAGSLLVVSTSYLRIFAVYLNFSKWLMQPGMKMISVVTKAVLLF
jgi:hypothetical protein